MVKEAKLLFILSMCITAKGDLEQISRDYQGLEIKMEDIGCQVLLLSVLQLKGHASGRSGYAL